MSPGRAGGGQGTGGALVLAGASLWGLIGLFNRALMGAGLSPRSIVLVRNLGGLAVLALVLLVWKRDAFRVSPRHLGWFFGTGVVSVLLFTWCYFSCQEQCSLAVAAILLYTSPAFVVVLSALLWREKLTRRKLAALGLTFGGCVLVTGVLSGGAQLTPAGFLLGLGAGFFYALYSIFGRYALAHYGPYAVTLYTFLFAGAGALVPITGFANAVASPALEFRAEGMITGLAAKLFIIAGPVIVYGTLASVVYGLILCLAT